MAASKFSLLHSVVVMACCLALIGCAPGVITRRAQDVSLIQGPPIQDIKTPFDQALSCLSDKIPSNAVFAVGAIADNTGKEQYADSGTGKMVTQGAGDMVQSALFQAGVRVVNRRDPNIRIAESNWGLGALGGADYGRSDPRRFLYIRQHQQP